MATQNMMSKKIKMVDAAEVMISKRALQVKYVQ